MSQPIKPIYYMTKISENDSSEKLDHRMSVFDLMQDDNSLLAIKLQLENLILTYGFETVKNQLENISTIKKVG